MYKLKECCKKLGSFVFILPTVVLCVDLSVKQAAQYCNSSRGIGQSPSKIKPADYDTLLLSCFLPRFWVTQQGQYSNSCLLSGSSLSLSLPLPQWQHQCWGARLQWTFAWKGQVWIICTRDIFSQTEVLCNIEGPVAQTFPGDAMCYQQSRHSAYSISWTWDFTLQRLA